MTNKFDSCVGKRWSRDEYNDNMKKVMFDSFFFLREE